MISWLFSEEEFLLQQSARLETLQQLQSSLDSEHIRGTCVLKYLQFLFTISNNTFLQIAKTNLHSEKNQKENCDCRIYFPFGLSALELAFGNRSAVAKKLAILDVILWPLQTARNVIFKSSPVACKKVIYI